MIHSKSFINIAVTSLVLLVIAGCAANRPAPVVDSRRAPPSSPVGKPVTSTPPAPTAEPAKFAPGDKVHVIQKGDTLISIALANGLDYRELALWNNIDNPNVIKLGEPLRLTPPGTPAQSAAQAAQAQATAQPKPGEPVATPLIITPMPTTGTSLGNTEKLKTEPKAGKVPYTDAAYAKLSADAAAAAGAAIPAIPAAPGAVAAPTPPPAATAPARNDDVDWAWPIQPQPKGKIVAMFTDANKGIDISGAKDSPVLASAPGKVVYSGAGLRGYGRLVIIKHNDTWLSAYAHNEKILVTEGQEVKKGQKIAEMGSSDADQVKLHFEIRKQGKPVDPMKHLPN
jgi:lipoprotein NlpD